MDRENVYNLPRAENDRFAIQEDTRIINTILINLYSSDNKLHSVLSSLKTLITS